MLDLAKRKLPQAVMVGGSFFELNTDFRYFLSLKRQLKERNDDLKVFDFIYKREPPADRLAGLKAVLEFMEPPCELPRRTGAETGEIVIDYDLDADYIFAAFWERYKIDLVGVEHLHWHKFTALLRGLHDTELNEIISARLWQPNGKNGEYEKSRQRQYEAWRLPQPDDQNDEALDDFNKALGGK